MKVLFDHPTPFKFAHGGFQIQIEQTKLALESCGVEVDWLRWWDVDQRGDIVHFFGRPSPWYVTSAQRAGMKVVVSELLTGLGSRGGPARSVQKLIISLLRRSYFFDRMGWNTFKVADACIALTAWEATLMQDMFGAPAERIHVVPNGVEAEFLSAPPGERGDMLVCTATITERKRVLELARAAVEAKTPLWIIGRPYSESDPYAKAFVAFVRKHQDVIRYEGAINDRAELAKIYRTARGFVLLSTMESLSLSALEAAACECPLLLSDLPWATTSFPLGARFCPDFSDSSRIAISLRRFYELAPTIPKSPRPDSWEQVATRLSAMYGRLLE